MRLKRNSVMPFTPILSSRRLSNPSKGQPSNLSAFGMLEQFLAPYHILPSWVESHGIDRIVTHLASVVRSLQGVRKVEVVGFQAGVEPLHTSLIEIKRLPACSPTSQGSKDVSTSRMSYGGSRRKREAVSPCSMEVVAGPTPCVMQGVVSRVMLRGEWVTWGSFHCASCGW